MTSLTPQTTGLGSRNPFAAILSAQNTGTSNASPSQANARAPSPSGIGRISSDRANEKPSESDVTPPSPPPKRQGVLNSPTNSTDDTPTISRQVASVSNQSTGPYNAPEGPPPGMAPRLPPRTPSTNADVSTDSARATGSAPNQHRSSTLDMLTEELPPAYTPGPDSVAGEQSVEFGPLRPFTNQPGRQPQQGFRPQPVPQQGLFSSQSGHYRSTSRNRNEPSLSRLLGNMLIDYITTPREEERRTNNTPGSLGRSISSQTPRPLQSIIGSVRAQVVPPRGGNNWSQYPGINRSVTPPPPQSLPSRGGNNWSQYPGISRAVTPPPPQSLPPNDGKPTVRPTPGHPLIKDGRVLVYPLGHECRKCHNRGFRPGHRSTFDDVPRALAPGDPSHPCKRCWRHYSRIYDASIARLDWTEAVETNFQRPISDASFMRPSTSNSTSSARNRNNINRGPSNAALLQPQSTGGPARWSQQTPGGGRTVYEPGDPRIGGRLCPRCRGDGSIRVFILELDRCPTCGGIGRVF